LRSEQPPATSHQLSAISYQLLEKRISIYLLTIVFQSAINCHMNLCFTPKHAKLISAILLKESGIVLL